ncbi:MAG: ABC transporter permease [Actinobacteria bacterium]|nr:ABC transporter permease [Actinomycetota bacterium]
MNTNNKIQKRIGLSSENFLTYSLAGVLVIFFITASIIVPTFFDLNGLINIISQQSYLIIIAVGVSFLLITGNFDLSVGGVAGAAGVLVAYFSQAKTTGSSSAIANGLGMNFYFAIFLTLIICVAIGAVNAYFIVKMKIGSVIVTLGTMYISRGIAHVVSQGAQRNVGLPENFGILGKLRMFDLFSLPVLIMIIAIILAFIIQKRTIFGRNLYYIGSNKITAQISGIKVEKHVATLYIVSAFLSGLAGIILASRFFSGRAVGAEGYEFDALVVALLGGMSITGAFGGVLNILIGAFILGILSTVLNQMGLPPDIQIISKGVIITISILAQRWALNKYKKIL